MTGGVWGPHTSLWSRPHHQGLRSTCHGSQASCWGPWSSWGKGRALVLVGGVLGPSCLILPEWLHFSLFYVLRFQISLFVKTFLVHPPPNLKALLYHPLT